MCHRSLANFAGPLVISAFFMICAIVVRLVRQQARKVATASPGGSLKTLARSSSPSKGDSNGDAVADLKGSKSDGAVLNAVVSVSSREALRKVEQYMSAINEQLATLKGDEPQTLRA